MNGHGNGTNGYNHSTYNGHSASSSNTNGYGGGSAGSSTSNGHGPTMTNGHAHHHQAEGGSATYPHKNGLSVVSMARFATPEMCFYCFDILYSNLNNVDLPKAPNFINDAL